MIAKKTNQPVALVTGAAVRIGKTIASTLAQSYRVAIHYHNSENAAQQLLSQLNNSNPVHSIFQSDLTSPKEASNLVTRVIDEMGRLDLLVNNAGVLTDDTANIMDLAKMKILNVDAPVHLMQHALPHLEQTAGAIVNIGDVAGLLEFPSHTAYSKSKGALLRHTMDQALDLAKKNIRINAICPGTVLMAEHLDRDTKTRIVEKIPMGRTGTPEDVADLVHFLARATFITGQMIAVDGGRMLVPTTSQ